MRVLATGATGNIGLSTVKTLVERGHQVRALIFDRPRTLDPIFQHPRVEPFSGDVRDAGRMRDAVQGQDAIIHLAYIIPPLSNERRQLARSVNLDGTRNLIDAALSLPTAPRFFFASSFDLFGDTTHLPPPRRVTDPVQVTDDYTAHKLQGEQWLQQSGLPWLIFRFADVPIIGFRPPHPIMFEIPLDQRIETLHSLDAACAIANALERREVWGRMWLIGGGNECQITYRQFLTGMFAVMGLGELPEQAFTTRPYVTDWLDTAESQAALQYQQRTFSDILREVEAKSGLQRRMIPLVRPLIHQYLLRMSPYMAATSGKSGKSE